MYNSRNLGLLYKRCGQVCITLYSDSSYGSVPKPAYGYVVFGNGTPLSWASKKEKIVPQSSAEAETYALNAGCKTSMFVKNMLAVLGMTVELRIQTHTDNDATRLTAINPGKTALTKHYPHLDGVRAGIVPGLDHRGQLGTHQGADRRPAHQAARQDHVPVAAHAADDRQQRGAVSTSCPPGFDQCLARWGNAN